jgi:hypothetical protein
MHPKIKNRPTGGEATVSPVKPLVLHDVTKPTARANSASRRRMTATQPASGTANHSRHHVSQHTQA